MADRLAVATGGRRSKMSGSDRADAAGTVEPDGWVHPSMGVEEEFLLVDPSMDTPSCAASRL